MFTAKMKPNIAAVSATLMTGQSLQLSGQITQKTKTGAGYGMGIFAPMAMAEWGAEAFLKLLTEQYGKKSTGRFRQVWFWTTFAGKGLALIPSTFAKLLSGKIIILGRSCGLFFRGAGSKTRPQSITDKAIAYRQPDLFIEPPKPQPKQEGFDL